MLCNYQFIFDYLTIAIKIIISKLNFKLSNYSLFKVFTSVLTRSSFFTNWWPLFQILRFKKHDLKFYIYKLISLYKYNSKFIIHCFLWKILEQVSQGKIKISNYIIVVYCIHYGKCHYNTYTFNYWKLKHLLIAVFDS